MSSFAPKNIAAYLALAATAANAHMMMKTPTPFSKATLDNSPLTGTNFPCKAPQGGSADYYKREGIITTMAIGESQTLSFEGSAVHGGGSCQLAITKDLAPTSSTSWQVILSIEGGCPTKDGSSPSEYDFKIPDSVAEGDYTFAWTWISKLAGQPEYYMNCAPITVTGGSKKRSTNETMELFSRDDLPELFVANLQGINDCKTEPSTDPEFPNPGSNVEKPNPNAKYSQVKGENCVPVGAKAGTGSGGSDGGDSNSPAPSSTPAAAPTSSTPAANEPSTGFITIPIATTSAQVPEPTTPAPAPTTTDAATSPAATSPAASTPVASTPVASTPAASPTSGAGGSGSGLSGPCTEEGTFNCDGSSYQQCASGAWTLMQALPAGTVCQNGLSAQLWARDTKNVSRRSRRRV